MGERVRKSERHRVGIGIITSVFGLSPKQTDVCIKRLSDSLTFSPSSPLSPTLSPSLSEIADEATLYLKKVRPLLIGQTSLSVSAHWRLQSRLMFDYRDKDSRRASLSYSSDIKVFDFDFEYFKTKKNVYSHG